MCGIVGFTGSQAAAPLLLDGLRKLEYRGYDSAGIAVQKDGALHMIKASGHIDALAEKTQNGTLLPGTSGIGHTRWATHGAPTDTNAHPHMSADGKFAIVHNGIIENYAALRDELKSKGFVFRSETDTEVIVHLLDMYYTGDLKAAVLHTAARLEGSYALGVLCADQPGTICAVKMASPLILGVGVGENFFASDVTALVSHTKNVIYLEDGEFAEITPDSISIYDSTGATVHRSISRIVWDIEAAEKGGYEHFMLKEIMEQPRALKATIAPRIKNGKIVLDDFDEAFRADFRYINRIVITACGSAYHAGCVGRYMIESLCRVPVEVDVASELRYRHPIVDEHTLLIAVSQSGETADTIAAIRECKAHGARVLTIVNVVGSTVAKLGDYVMYTWAGPEIAVATTKAYSAQLAALYLISVKIARVRSLISIGDERALCAELQRLPECITEALKCQPDMQRIATLYANRPSVFFLGRGLDYAAALEASLKLKEISYIHSEAYAAGELKHGTISLIEDGTLVVALATQPALFEKTVSNIREVVARGASVVLVTTDDFTGDESVCQHIIRLPKCLYEFSASLSIIPMQLFAYYVACAKGCDVDKPRNLAKSVTVE